MQASPRRQGLKPQKRKPQRRRRPKESRLQARNRLRKSTRGNRMPKALTTSILLFFLLLAGLCQASSVSRSFSKNITLMSENINVSLAVSITLPQDTYYAIDESYPSGWTMISTNGDTNQSGHIKWAVIDNAVNTVYSYTIRAAASPGNYTFSGFYEFNSTYTNPSSPSIAGQTRSEEHTSELQSRLHLVC